MNVNPPLISKYKDVFIGSNLIRLCSNCSIEYGISDIVLSEADWKVTHGRCHRHMVSLLKQAGLKPDDILSALNKISDINAHRDTTNVRDLSKYSSELIGWLRNPTPYNKKTI